MRQKTRFKFNAYLTRQAELNGVDTGDLNKKFSVEPSVTQTIMTRVQESSEFLSRINIVPVAELTAEKIGLGVNGSVASTTDTDGGDERETAEFASLDSEKYFCEQVNFDFHMRYNTLDLWARYQDFQTRLRDAIIQRQALDRIIIGFNGTHRAKTSNRALNPLLQDIAPGWLQKYRNNAPKRVMSKIIGEDGEVVSEKIRVGHGGDYVNLDALVMDARSSMIAEWYQEDPELVVITGRNLMQDKYFPLVNKEQDNSETIAADVIISQKRIGNLPAVSVPYFPPNALLITRLDNLSIYWLEDSHRRHIDENAKRDRIENYESIKQDYVVEDYACGCLVENIEILPVKKDIASAPAAAALMVSEAPNYDGLAAAIMAAVNVAANPNEVKPEATADATTATESTAETPATKGSK
ncbi:phage major capsid protein, P2 family [Yersinia enterocolitica]|uniref:Major capsid protein n=1 Tax=Yersinia phage vB_YenM_201.16 TaxID=2918921 RepID=A0AAE9FQN0_9CAUD|nr:phage major capsid protein, P2 family [Yersinia enterocolitica]YP_010664232.1 major head protein [Yersinia phage vB_YenM_201.16]EKN3564408.1 phage major capsid protein, P2 family [Yersinia enterocolitica]EKN4118693.1 phage major capsid protein, P2 family [Yersinia enterocolitica]EKN4871900.1 phage major capsid protein, P2 family [Yersinia enterocolitica]EKN4884258.1 phage major capsid protein, P2 family [Yersinia enterocolitica]EKN4888452.1 phage major capsid protein, P2 family [Yersinia e